MLKTVVHAILAEIQSVEYYSIIADEATDVSRHEQMCMCICWVNDEYEVNEDPTGFVQVPKTDSQSYTLLFVMYAFIVR